MNGMAHPNVNDACIMIGVCHAPLDRDSGVPRAVRCVANGDRHLPAERCTVLRKDDEPHAVFWQRVVNTVRGLKLGRAFDHTVVLLVFHEGDPLPDARECMQDDANFNVKRTLWHTAIYARDGRMRIGALCMLADLSQARAQAKH